MAPTQCLAGIHVGPTYYLGGTHVTHMGSRTIYERPMHIQWDTHFLDVAK